MARRTFLVPPQWAFIKKKIADLPIPDQMLISLIFRKEALHSGGSTRKVIFPKGFDHLLAGDEITVIGEAHVMQHLEEFFGLHKKPVGSVTIAGASPIAFHLTRLLLQQKIQVKILEKEEKKCLLLSDEFPTATILNQDATDLSFLLSQEKASDAFICCMLKDETNILIAALAKQAGYEQVLTLISDSNLAPLLKHLGVSYSLSEKVCIGNRIHSLLKQETVLSISSFYENQVKILEVKVSSDSQIVGIPIRDLKDYLPQDLLIALIENRGRILVAKGNHILAPGDTVIVVCSPKHMSELENLF
jgi:trk system potassium uptake protein